LRLRLQTSEGQALGLPDAAKRKLASEGNLGLPVAIGQRNYGVHRNSLGFQGLPLGSSCHPAAQS
jgi:hypothetical protein